MTALSTLLALLSLDDSPYLEALTNSQAATNSFATNLSNVGGAVVVGALTAAGTAIVAVGSAAWDAGNTVDEAMDRISTSTGAVGPELDSLRSDFEAVFTSVPTDAGSAADAIGALNSRLDLSGPALQNLAKPLLEVSRLLGGDVKTNSEDFTRVIGDWNIPVEDAAGSLDKLFVASQQTGAPLDQLMQRVVQYGAPMRNFGFSFEEATGILASFEAQGVNTEIVLSGMRIAQGKFIKDGKDMKTGLWESIDAIKNATTETEAMTIATDTFGSKAAGDMFDTIRSGKFDVDALVESMNNSEGAIMNAGAATADWGEKWQMFKNRITTVLAPIGEKMMDGVSKAMDAVVAIFERPDVQAGISTFVTMIGDFIAQAVSYIPVLIDGFFQFVSFLQNNQGIVIGVLAALGVAAVAWGVVTAAAAWAAVVPLLPVIGVLLLIAGAAYLLYQAWTNNWGGIQEKVGAVWAVVQPVFQEIWNWLSTNVPLALQTLQTWWTTVTTALSAVWINVLWPAIQAVWGWLSGTLFPFFQALGAFLGAVFGKALEALAGIWQNVLGPALKTTWDLLSQKLQPAFQALAEFWTSTLQPVVQAIASWIGEKVVGAFRNLGTQISGVISWLQKMAAIISGLSLPSWMTPGSPTPWEIGLRGVSSAMSELSRSQLPTLNAALDVQASPAMIGNSQGSFAASVAGAGGGGLVLNVDVKSDGVTDEKDIARKIEAAVSVILRQRGLA